MPETSNPARRLLAVVEAIRGLPASLNGYEAWGRVLDLDYPRDAALFLRRGYEIGQLIEEIAERISPLEEAELALARLDNLKRFARSFHMIESTNTQTILSPLDETTVYSLQWCARLLDKVAPEPTLHVETLAFLAQRIGEAIAAVEEAGDLDPRVKVCLLKALHELAASIAGYALVGFDGVAQAGGALSGVASRPTVLTRLRDSQAMKAVVSVIVAVDIALNIAANTASIGIYGSEDDPKSLVSPSVVHIAQQCNVPVNPADIGLPMPERPKLPSPSPSVDPPSAHSQ